MTAHNCLYLTALVLAIVGWGTFVSAEDDVTVITPSAASSAPKQKSEASDGTPVVHKSLHKKKKSTDTETASGTGAQSNPAPSPATAPNAPASTAAPVVTVENKPAPKPAPSVVVSAVHSQPTAPPPVHAPVIPVAMKQTVVVVSSAVAPAPALAHTQTQSVAVTNTAITKNAPVYNPPITVSQVAVTPALVPTVETGLPVGRYSGTGIPITGVSTYVPATIAPPVKVTTGKSITGTTTHQPLYASVLPTSVVPLTSTAAGSYSAPSRTTSPSTDFVFANFSKKPKNFYPWKTGIITTIFWIGEGGSTISSTDNVASAWDENWRVTNRGTDNPNDRNGFASGAHASTVNPFYVALPFNDLAFPDKAHQWVPRSWHRPREDGKEVSACKDRWVWIKNANGRSCFAQWEDVGPLRYDHAEYVFGNDRPDTYTRAGLDVSPAVADYLGIRDNSRAITSWRFVDDEDVPPGAWLKYDEQAVIYTALHQLKNGSPSDLPIQKATEPIDEQNIDSNKRKVDASKG